MVFDFGEQSSKLQDDRADATKDCVMLSNKDNSKTRVNWKQIRATVSANQSKPTQAPAQEPQKTAAAEAARKAADKAKDAADEERKEADEAKVEAERECKEADLAAAILDKEEQEAQEAEAAAAAARTAAEEAKAAGDEEEAARLAKAAEEAVAKANKEREEAEEASVMAQKEEAEAKAATEKLANEADEAEVTEAAASVPSAQKEPVSSEEEQSVVFIDKEPLGVYICVGPNESVVLKGSNKDQGYKLDPDANAAKKGLQSGDMIVQVNGQSTSGMDVSQVKNLIVSVGRPLELLVRRPPGAHPGQSSGALSGLASSHEAIPPTQSGQGAVLQGLTVQELMQIREQQLLQHTQQRQQMQESMKQRRIQAQHQPVRQMQQQQRMQQVEQKGPGSARSDPGAAAAAESNVDSTIAGTPDAVVVAQSAPAAVNKTEGQQASPLPSATGDEDAQRLAWCNQELYRIGQEVLQTPRKRRGKLLQQMAILEADALSLKSSIMVKQSHVLNVVECLDMETA